MSVADERAGPAAGWRRGFRDWAGRRFRRPRSTADAFAPGRDEEGHWSARLLAVEESARSGFFLAPLGMIAGVAIFHGADLRPGLAAASISCLSLALALFALRERVILRSVLCVGLFAFVGIGLSGIELRRTTTTLFSGEATVRIEGRVAWRDVDDRGRYRYLIDIASTDRPVLSRPPERARVVVSSRHEPIPVGGSYEGLVRLRPPSGPALPGSYDFAFAPFFQGLGAYGFSLGAPEPPDAVDPSDLDFGERVASLRIRMAERIRSVVEGAEGAVASALITGERAGIPEEIDEWLRITGLAHVLSISGFHMVLVAGFTMLAVRAAAAAIPGLALVVSTKKIAAAAAILVSSAYVLIAGDNVATQRSYIMLLIMLGAVLLDRPALTLRNVAIAALFIMMTSPHAVMTASFQMSFAATAALVGAYASLMRWWGASGQRRSAGEGGLVRAALLFTVALALSSLIAGGATTPYGAYHFQRAAPLGGLIANVLVMPLFSFWIMPLALLAVLAMPFGLDAPLLILMGHGLTLVFEMAERLAAWFPDYPTGRMSPLALVLLTGAVLALCFFASAARWLCVPLLVAGLLAAPMRAPPPELLIFEDGKQLALIDEAGRLVHLKERPNGFVDGQWQRAFPPPSPGAAHAQAETIAGSITGGALPSQAASASLLDAAVASPGDRSAADGFACEADVCRAVTRSGLTIAWTEDYEKTGLLCDSADIAIVSRAIRLAECRSGAHLVTLRTLRRTGSLAVSRDAGTGLAVVTPSIGAEPREWNIHRHADWPEYWRNPDSEPAAP